MNILTLLFFVFMVAVLSAAIIKVNASEEGGASAVVINVVIGICITAMIIFLPFGADAPKTLFGRAVNALKPEKPVEAVITDKPSTNPVTETAEPEDEELSDFVVYECDDYYIKMSREDHVMEIVPSDERWEDVKATEKLAYYDFSGEYKLDGHDINVYAARLAGDSGFVCVVLFEEYYQDEVNTAFYDEGHLFRIYDEEKGYAYGYAYTYDSLNRAWNYSYFMNNDKVYFKGMYDALKLDKKYFEADE